MKKYLLLFLTFLFVSNVYCDGMGYMILVPIFYAFAILLIINFLSFVIYLFFRKLKFLCILTLIPITCCSIYLILTLFYIDYEFDWTEIIKVILFVYSLLQIITLKYWKWPNLLLLYRNLMKFIEF